MINLIKTIRKPNNSVKKPAATNLFRLGFPFLAVWVFANAALGQSTDEAPTVDPLDTLCASIGRPVTKEELVGFSDYVVHGIASPYTEVIGRFNEGRARSVRYMPDESRSAQYLQIKDREICFATDGTSGATCGIPLVCTSGEADYVMVDENDNPYARIDKPNEPDNNTPSPVERSDWVTFAGGSTRMNIENTRFRSRGATSARNIVENNRCRVGSGYPELDQAYAYYWKDSSCDSAYASGVSSVIYLNHDGVVQSENFGPGTGIKTESGNLYWSFTQPVSLAVECSNADDTKIPQSAADVKHISVRMTVSPTVNIANPVIYNKLVSEADQFVERICGVRPIPNQTEYLFERSGTADGDNINLSLLLNRDGLQVRVDESPDYRQRSEAITSATRNASYAHRFAVFIRQVSEAKRKENMLQILRDNGRMTNFADGVRASDVEALVALIDGLTIRMPWAGLNPAFIDGKFRITWNVSSTDPVNDFFQNRRQNRGWRALERRIPTIQNSVSVQLSCNFPAAEADSLPVEGFVDVEASLIRHEGNTFALRCVAP